MFVFTNVCFFSSLTALYHTIFVVLLFNFAVYFEDMDYMGDLFEGYAGMQLWGNQAVSDLLFLLLTSSFALFAIFFRTNYRFFFKMMKDVVQVKERQSIFEKSVGSDEIFRSYMTFQSLFLCSIFFFLLLCTYGSLHTELTTLSALRIIGLIFLALFLFYLFKQGINRLIAFIFAETVKYKIWKGNYNAVMGSWGVLLYLPVVWLAFGGKLFLIPLALFVLLYIACRIVIIYKIILIFPTKNIDLLFISLYLCAQEILPLVFLYEGMIVLYNFINTNTLWH